LRWRVGSWAYLDTDKLYDVYGLVIFSLAGRGRIEQSHTPLVVVSQYCAVCNTVYCCAVCCWWCVCVCCFFPSFAGLLLLVCFHPAVRVCLEMSMPSCSVSLLFLLCGDCCLCGTGPHYTLKQKTSISAIVCAETLSCSVCEAMHVSAECVTHHCG